jgi:hypothetical protein
MPTLHLALRASRGLAAALLVVHSAGAAAIFLAAPGWPGKVLAVLLIALGAVAAWDRALLRGPQSVRAIELGGEGRFEVLLASGRRLQGRAHGRRHVSAWWVLLPVKGWRGAVLVASGMLDAGAFRRLRIWALWGRVPVPGPQAAAG